MNRTLSAAALLLSFSLLPGCGSASESEAREELESFIAAQKDEPLVYTLHETDPLRGLKRRTSCAAGPSGGCEGETFHLFTHDTSPVWLQLSFRSGIVDDMRVERMREELHVVSYTLYGIGDLSAPGWSYKSREQAHAAGEEDFELQLTEYANGRLKGELRSTIEEIIGVKNSDACENPPQDASSPEGCRVRAAAQLPVRIVFDLPVIE